MATYNFAKQKQSLKIKFQVFEVFRSLTDIFVKFLSFDQWVVIRDEYINNSIDIRRDVLKKKSYH